MIHNKQYDIIIIGSGIGALTVASIMAKVNKKKILILERHSKIGGYTHSFSRKKYKWDVGLHYIGKMFTGKLPETILKFITNNNLLLKKIDDPYETFIYPDLAFEVYSEKTRFQSDLIKKFPHEEKAIRTYFKDIKSIYQWFVRYYLCRFLPWFLKIPFEFVNKITQKKALGTTEEYLQNNFKDEKLKSLLASQWGNYGLPPSQSAFLIHSIVVNHFINGGYYPKGGSDKIAKSIIPEILKQGGKYLVNHHVSRVIIENNQAVGVEVQIHKKNHTQTMKYYAPIIVSNIGIFNTFTKLISDDVHIPFKKKFTDMSNPATCVTLYIGLKDDVSALGLKSSNVWIYNSYNHDQNYCNNTLMKGKSASCFFSSIIHSPDSNEKNTAVIIAFLDYANFDKWKHQLSGKRDKDYYLLKDTISSGLLSTIEDYYPGFKKHITYTELATPLTSEHYTDHPEGAMYGIPATPERYRQKWIQAKTPIKNLYLTGSDVSSLGIVSSMLGGFATACALSGPFGLFKLIFSIKRHNRRSSTLRRRKLMQQH